MRASLEPEATIAKKKSRKELKSDMKPYQCILQIWTSCHSAWLPYQPQPHFFAASEKEVETIVAVNKNDKTMKKENKSITIYTCVLTS